MKYSISGCSEKFDFRNTPAAIPHFTQYYASAIPAGTAGGTNVSVGGVQDYMVGGRYSAATAGGNSAAAAQQLLQFSAATPQTAMAAQIQAYSTQQAAAAA
ncbi:unnamed protein product, partial [Anisakis simplex]|uniref:DUF1897 domain-containing protein n=1 Tax=Anisakis simplex TaxID=6269 RepID=A0A0M3JL89_ANISI